MDVETLVQSLATYCSISDERWIETPGLRLILGAKCVYRRRVMIKAVSVHFCDHPSVSLLVLYSFLSAVSTFVHVLIFVIVIACKFSHNHVNFRVVLVHL